MDDGNVRVPESVRLYGGQTTEGKTIEAAYAYGSMMPSLRQAQIQGLRNANQIYHLKQVGETSNVGVVKKSMASILDYLRWEDEKVFQSTWVMEDGTVLMFFPNVIKDIVTYVTNCICVWQLTSTGF